MPETMNKDEYRSWVEFQDWVIADALGKGRNVGQARSLLESPTGRYAWKVWQGARGAGTPKNKNTGTGTVSELR